MYVVRLNNVNIQVKGQNVFIYDVFGDTSEPELHAMITYLVDEGFVNPKKDVNVFIKAQSFIPAERRKDGKKKG